MIRRIPAAAAALVLVAAPTLAVLAGGTAQATTPDPSGANCGTSYTTSVPSAGRLKISVTISCTTAVASIRHGITIQRSGSAIDIDGKACTATRSCTWSGTYDDPSGTQKWEILDELSYTGGGSNLKYYAAFSH